MNKSDDDFGRSLADLLHDQQPDLDGWDLCGSSVARAQTVRRRRRAVAAGVVVAGLVASAAVIAGGLGAYRVDTGPVAPTSASPAPPSRSGEPVSTPTNSPAPTPTVTASPSVRPASTKTANVDIDTLRRGSSAMVDWVENGVWHKADGTSVRVGVPAGSDQAARFVAFGENLLAQQWSLGGPSSDDAVWLVAADGSKKKSVVGDRFVRGPEGSVLWPERATIQRIDPDGRRTTFSLPASAAQGGVTEMAATRNAPFLTDRNTVTRYTINGAKLTDPVVIPGATTIVLGDPDSDQVVVANADDCTATLPAPTSSPPRWDCRYRTTAVSPDGRWGYAADGNRERAVLVGSDGQPRLILKHAKAEGAAVGHHASVVLVASKSGDVSNRSALVECTAEGRCHRISDIVEILYNSGDRPLEIVQR